MKDAFETTKNDPSKAESSKDTDTDTVAKGEDSILRRIVAQLAPESADKARTDDELVVAISLEKLLNQEQK